MVSRPLGVSILLLWGASVACAQFGPGDLVVGCLPPGQGLYRVTATGTVETILDAAYTFPNAVTMAADNTDLAVAMADPVTSYVANPFYRVDPGKRVTTLATIRPGPPNALDLAENGDWLVFAAGQNAVLALGPNGAFRSTLARLPEGSLNAGAVDIADGGTWLGAYWQLPQGGVLRAAPDGSLRTVVWGLGRVSGLAADSVRGDVVVTRFDAPEVLRVAPDGRVTSLLGFAGANAVAVDADGTLWLAAGRSLLHATASGTPIRSFPLPGPAAALTIYGYRTLVGSGRAAPGSTFTLSIRSHRTTDSGQPYRLVASTARAPALPLGDGRVLAVGPSPLLWLSLLGQVPGLQGFAGQLDPFGHATAAVHVPAGLAGLRLFIAGVVIDPRVGRVSTVLNAVGVTLQ